MDDWNTIVSFWNGLFSGAFAVSFRECTGIVILRLAINTPLLEHTPFATFTNRRFHGIPFIVGQGQWLFLVPLKGGRWHIIPQLAVYTTYIPWLYATYHLLREPETTIDRGIALPKMFAFNFPLARLGRHCGTHDASASIVPFSKRHRMETSWLVGGDTHTQTLNVWYIY